MEIDCFERRIGLPMSRTNMLTKPLAVGIMLSNGLASGNSKLFFAIAGCVSEDGTLAEAILMGTDAQPADQAIQHTGKNT